MSQQRFAYGNDNPTNYTDPSGYGAIPWPSVPWPSIGPVAAAAAAALRTVLVEAGIAIAGAITLEVLAAVAAGVAIGLVIGCLIIEGCREGIARLFGTDYGRAQCAQAIGQIIIKGIQLLSSTSDKGQQQGGSQAGSGGRTLGDKNLEDLPPGAKLYQGTDAPKRVYDNLEGNHGVTPEQASERLHKIKDKAGLGAAENALFSPTGDVYDPRTGEWIGSLITER